MLCNLEFFVTYSYTIMLGVCFAISHGSHIVLWFDCRGLY